MSDLYVEEMAFELGQLHARKSDDIQRKEWLIEQLKVGGILIKNEHVGVGWQLKGSDSSPVIPLGMSGSIWRMRGYAFAYWMGLGQPKDVSMVCESDPLVEWKSMNRDGPVDLDEESQRGRSILTVVR